MLLIHPYAFACRCGLDLTPCEAYGRANAILVGRAIDGEYRKEESKADGKQWIRLGGKVRFIVEQSFKGVYGNEVEVGDNSASCGFGYFEKGERYLLYLIFDDYTKIFWPSICSRSAHISDADEDLKFLSSLTSKTCGARLYGSVGYFDKEYVGYSPGMSPVRQPYTGVPGITITVRDNHGQILTAVTDRKGAYEFTGVLPDVEYTVRAELPGYFRKTKYFGKKEFPIIFDQKVQIPACACVRVNFPAIYDGSISGRATGPDGKPVTGVKVAIVRADEKASNVNTLVCSATTDKKGHYLLEEVPSGNFVLGVNITVAPDEDSPYRPTWYPDAANRPAAAVIEVGPGQKLSGYDLVVSRRLAVRTIEGTVFWPDGTPAAEARVYLATSVLTQSGQGTGGRNSIPTDKKGRFKITGCESIAYYVVAASAPKWDELYPFQIVFYAEPPLVEFKGGDVTGLRLTLSWDKGTLRDFFEKKRDQQK